MESKYGKETRGLLEKLSQTTLLSNGSIKKLDCDASTFFTPENLLKVAGIVKESESESNNSKYLSACTSMAKRRKIFINVTWNGNES